MRCPNWLRCTIPRVLQGFAERARLLVRRYRWWLSLTRPFTRPCPKSPGSMRSLWRWPSGIGSAAMVFTELRMPRSRTGTRLTRGHPLEQVRLITLQLGNGCSVAAIAQGRSVETSMGFTPLEGLVMGTRSGDVDASIVNFLSEREKVEPDEVERWLNERSGLLGLSGGQTICASCFALAEQEQDKRAEFAIDLFCYRVRKYLGAYLAVLEGADAVVFGGGIGENAPEIRERICQNMKWCGLELNRDLNRAAVGLTPGRAAKISEDGSRLAAYVVASDEETWIARETVRCVRGVHS